MTPFLPFARLLRLVLLVGSVLLAPQLQLVHALSHGVAAQQDGKDRQGQADKACDTCLSLVQLDAALPARFDWAAEQQAAPASPTLADAPCLAAGDSVFLARGPPRRPG